MFPLNGNPSNQWTWESRRKKKTNIPSCVACFNLLFSTSIHGFFLYTVRFVALSNETKAHFALSAMATDKCERIKEKIENKIKCFSFRSQLRVFICKCRMEIKTERNENKQTKIKRAIRSDRSSLRSLGKQKNQTIEFNLNRIELCEWLFGHGINILLGPESQILCKQTQIDKAESSC